MGATRAVAVEAPPDVPRRFPALRDAASFIAHYKIRLTLVSALVLIPCFWHQRIEAGDLSSHLYNSWLAQLIRQGRVPGLWLAHLSNNILFDLMVGRTAALFGFPIAEKVCVSATVLIFFWGAFAFISAASRRAPWFLLPLLTMLTYGWTFNMGFFNFYLSFGLAFLALAVVWRGRNFDFLLPILVMPLIWLAHPLGLALFLALAAYVGLTRVLKPLHQVVLLASATAIVVAFSRYVRSHYPVKWSNVPFYLLNGADQIALFNSTYDLLSVILALAVVAFILCEAVGRERAGFLRDLTVPAQLYAVLWLTLSLLPNTIALPQYSAPVAFLVTRTSLALGVLGCCMLAAVRPRVWHVGAFAAIAALFFVSLFLDTARMNDMESQAEKLVSTLPAGQRVISSAIPLPPSGFPMWHLIDRACIGHCFIYSNYEPSSLQFQIRASAGNPIVVTDTATVQAMQMGEYVVGDQDLPLYEIAQCSSNRLQLCGRFLKAGDRNGVQPRQ